MFIRVTEYITHLKTKKTSSQTNKWLIPNGAGNSRGDLKASVVFIPLPSDHGVMERNKYQEIALPRYWRATGWSRIPRNLRATQSAGDVAHKHVIEAKKNPAKALFLGLHPMRPSWMASVVETVLRKLRGSHVLANHPHGKQQTFPSLLTSGEFEKRANGGLLVAGKESGIPPCLSFAQCEAT